MELNRRIAPDVYLGVVEVREHEGTYSIDGPGETVEYAVKMRQLPKDRTLTTLLKKGQVTTDDARNLARVTAEFHDNAETSPAIARAGNVAEVRRNVEENFAQTGRLIGKTISREMYEDIQAFSEGFLECGEDLLEGRVLKGRVRDCHGISSWTQVAQSKMLQESSSRKFTETPSVKRTPPSHHFPHSESARLSIKGTGPVVRLGV